MDNTEEIYGVVYIIVNTINNKRYVGQTINGFNGRYYKGNWPKYTKNKALLEDLNKYGRNAFYVVEEFDTAYCKDELDCKEIFWISFFKSNINGYNVSNGGTKSFDTDNETYIYYSEQIKSSDLYLEESLKLEYENNLYNEYMIKKIEKMKLLGIYDKEVKMEHQEELYFKMMIFSMLLNVVVFMLLFYAISKM